MQLICQRCLQYDSATAPRYLEFEERQNGENKILIVKPCPACLKRESIASFDEGFWTACGQADQSEETDHA